MRLAWSNSVEHRIRPRIDAFDARVGSSAAAQLGILALLTAAVTGALVTLDADLAAASLAFLAVVVFVARYGHLHAALSVACTFLALNWWFTSPTGALEIAKVEDLVPLLAFAIAAVPASFPAARHDLRPLVAILAVGGASALLLAGDADLVVAALCLLGVVVVTAVMGVASATTAVVASYIALNYWFTPPLGSLEITKVQDLVPLVAFTLAAATSAATVARVHWLHRRAVMTEQHAFDARVAQATSDSRAAFLASMTHNLRTPLATIKASVSALLASPDGDVGQRISLLANARAETDRLERLVTKVLQLARIHAGTLEPSPEPVDVGEMAGVAGRRLQHLASEKGLRVAVTGDLVMALVDPDMLELVLIALLENALRFAPPGTEITVVVADERHERAVVRVIDRGPGVPDAKREEVFDEFVRLDRANPGSGLGLTIARSMVEAHDGRLWIEETPAGGATVVMSLPLVTASVPS